MGRDLCRSNPKPCVDQLPVTCVDQLVEPEEQGSGFLAFQHECRLCFARLRLLCLQSAPTGGSSIKQCFAAISRHFATCMYSPVNLGKFHGFSRMSPACRLFSRRVLIVFDHVILCTSNYAAHCCSTSKTTNFATIGSIEI